VTVTVDVIGEAVTVTVLGTVDAVGLASSPPGTDAADQ
jgi:hypothetical protein